jgi:hypothetical protein
VPTTNRENELPNPGSNIIDRLVRYALGGGLPQLIFILGLAAGAIALMYTPREEEPQIVVPMVDVMVEAPGLRARQVERQVTTELEKLLSQIPGVENVYSATASGLATVTLAFYVGEDREDSLLNTYNKVHSNQDRIPPVVSQWFRRRIPDRAASWSGPYCPRTASCCQVCTPACRFPRETAHAC